MKLKTANSFPRCSVKTWIKQFGDYLPDPLSQRIDVDSYAEKVLSRGKVVLAMLEDEPLGLVTMYANDHKTKRAYMSLLAVRPEARGHGVGRILVDACIAQARENGMTEIRLQTLGGNRQAMRLYESAGFCKVGVNGQKVVLEKVVPATL
jgi:ribosomal protein S18 acetylase RimI-like enzyme